VTVLAVCCLIPSSRRSVMRYATEMIGFAACWESLCSTTAENNVLARLLSELLHRGVASLWR